MKKPNMTPSELKARDQENGNHFFDRDTMKFFGDTMRNYGVRAYTVPITTNSGETVECWELYRRKAVKHGLRNSVFFCAKTFRIVFPKKHT